MGASNPPNYLLGHSASELRRLEEQAQFFGSLTKLVFREAGLSEGMRVLDVGSGAGDVSLLAGSFVGPGGEVIGVDRSGTRSRRRTIARGRPCLWPFHCSV
ncbi:MAG: methyltransferase domain-containing protein [Chthoniobacterales bacterium]